MFTRVSIDNKALMDATLTRWKQDAAELGEEGVFLVVDVEERLAGLDRRTKKEKDVHCYFLVKEGNVYASSVMEVAHAMPNSDKPWLKLLDITLRPALLPVGGKAESMEVAKEAYITLGATVSHALALTFEEHPSKELKIFGRTDEMVNLFRSILSTGYLDSILDSLELKVKLEGNWLVVVKN